MPSQLSRHSTRVRDAALAGDIKLEETSTALGNQVEVKQKQNLSFSDSSPGYEDPFSFDPYGFEATFLSADALYNTILDNPAWQGTHDIGLREIPIHIHENDGVEALFPECLPPADSSDILWDLAPTFSPIATYQSTIHPTGLPFSTTTELRNTQSVTGFEQFTSTPWECYDFNSFNFEEQQQHVSLDQVGPATDLLFLDYLPLQCEVPPPTQESTGDTQGRLFSASCSLPGIPHPPTTPSRSRSSHLSRLNVPANPLIHNNYTRVEHACSPSHGAFASPTPRIPHNFRSVWDIAATWPAKGRGPPIPQRIHRTYHFRDGKRQEEAICSEEPIMFYLQNPDECGIPLKDALSGKFARLTKRNDSALPSSTRSTVSIKLDWPGYQTWGRRVYAPLVGFHRLIRIPFTSPPGPFTKAELAKRVGKVVERFIQLQVKSKKRGGFAEDVQWQVGPGHICVDDLVLVGLQHVGQDTWQPHLRLIRPRV